MTKNETIQILQSIEDKAVDFPNMTECDWVAIAAKRHLINDIEVKEVDLEKEVIDWWNAHYSSKAYTFEGYTGHYVENSTLIEIAKHFYELGLKTQKPAFEIEQLKKKVEKLMYDYNQMADIGSTGEVFDEKIMDAKYQVCKDILQYINELTTKLDDAKQSTFKIPQAKERKILYSTEIDI